MKRRLGTQEEQQAALCAAIEFLERDLQQTPAVRSFGRGYLYNYVRLKGGILVSQNRLYDFYRSVFPEEVQRRREGNFKHRTDFTVPGPNFLWCLDGLRAGASDRWISFFNELASSAVFVESRLSDQIALYAIYTPMIKDEFATFVDLWNSHKIRTQRNRQHVVSGRPMDLYNTDQVRNWGVPLREDDDIMASEVLQDLLEPIQDIDIDSFLPQETEDWCNQELTTMGFGWELDPGRDHKHPFFGVYIQLRNRIRQHQESGHQPILAVAEPPRGGLARYEQLEQILERNHTLLQAQTRLQGDVIPPSAQHQFRLFEEEDIQGIPEPLA
ncbi:hypothetical protein HRG_013846 [Hirsutella rhossiliensis]